jgi:hypothetical protein
LQRDWHVVYHTTFRPLIARFATLCGRADASDSKIVVPEDDRKAHSLGDPLQALSEEVSMTEAPVIPFNPFVSPSLDDPYPALAEARGCSRSSAT